MELSPSAWAPGQRHEQQGPGVEGGWRGCGRPDLPEPCRLAQATQHSLCFSGLLCCQQRMESQEVERTRLGRILAKIMPL